MREKLSRTAAQAARLVAGWAERLDDDDRRHLVAAFHRAESLAEQALEAALAGAAPEHRVALTEQLTDERRHVDVFARWGAHQPLPRRPLRQRPPAVWLGLLLANEVAGYCQFQMLLALVPGDARAADVEAILIDEERHIARLIEWLEPVWQRGEARVLADLLAGFVRDLESRMASFLPRPSLAELSSQMARLCAALLADLVPAVRFPAGMLDGITPKSVP